MTFGITTHTIVKNEEKYIKYALLSVINFIDRMLVWDTGSSDKTMELIKSIKSKKIQFKQFSKVNRKKIVFLRNEQIKLTKTAWFLILDGDEIWPNKNLLTLIKSMKKANETTIALVNKTRNCIRDIYHYLPEERGYYHIGPWQGHLNIRAIRNIKKLKVVGEYPLESFSLRGIPIQKLINRLEFVDTWYLHTTHLKRSNWLDQIKVIDRLKKFKFSGSRLKLKEEEIPEVLRE